VLQQAFLVGHGVHRQQLDRGDAETLEMLDDRQGGEPGVGATQRRGHLRVLLREALHMQLVEHRVAHRRARRPVIAPAERAVDHLATALSRGDPAADQACIGVEQRPGGIEAVAARRLVRAVHAVRIELPRARFGQVAVPDEIAALAQLDALPQVPFRAAALTLEQAQLDALGVLREKGEIDSRAVPGRPERIRAAAPSDH